MGHDRAGGSRQGEKTMGEGVILFFGVTSHHADLFCVAWSASFARAPRVTVVSLLSR